MKRVVVFLLLAGCARPSSTASAPTPRTWAVVPVEQGGELAELLADELVRAREVRVVRPADFGSSVDVGAAVAAARAHRAERILAVKIRRHDPYDPPRTSVAVEVLRADARSLSGGELDRLTSSASWRSAPLPPGREHAGHGVASFELVVDARDPATRSWLSSYAETRRSPDGAWTGIGEFLAVEARWMEFVAHVVVHRVPAE